MRGDIRQLPVLADHLSGAVSTLRFQLERYNRIAIIQLRKGLFKGDRESVSADHYIIQ